MLCEFIENKEKSAAAHRHDDLDLIAFGQRHIAVAAFGHDLAVKLYRNAFAGVAQDVHQLGNRAGRRAFVGFAIESNVHGRGL